jgi:hypothetical protein
MSQRSHATSSVKPRASQSFGGCAALVFHSRGLEKQSGSLRVTEWRRPNLLIKCFT